MDIIELYTLSLTEPLDVIESMDHENAKLIKKFNRIEQLRCELYDAGVTSDKIDRMKRIRKYIGLRQILRDRFDRLLCDQAIIDIVSDGMNADDLAGVTGIDRLTIIRKLHAMGFEFNHIRNKWEKRN